MKIVLTLYQGQSSVERIFSISNVVFNVNIKEESVVAKNIVKDNLIPNGFQVESITIMQQNNCSVGTARQRYDDFLAENK